MTCDSNDIKCKAVLGFGLSALLHRFLGSFLEKKILFSQDSLEFQTGSQAVFRHSNLQSNLKGFPLTLLRIRISLPFCSKKHKSEMFCLRTHLFTVVALDFMHLYGILMARCVSGKCQWRLTVQVKSSAGASSPRLPQITSELKVTVRFRVTYAQWADPFELRNVVIAVWPHLWMKQFSSCVGRT